ncbi:hypothetical protein [Desulfitobacterium sp. AusDCA]|uniref:hypothetical protein n=1 Tax=Desulfitobacterium sp. AusDCA TaxID=3240383 RepID=UPI003DA79D2F
MEKLSRTKGMVISLISGVIITYVIAKGVYAIGGPRVQMVMVKNGVKAGNPITDLDVRTETMPAKFAVNAISNLNDVVGKSAAIELTPGHPVIKGDVSDKPMQDGLYPGEVKLRVPVDAVSSGGAKAGDLVDVSVSNSGKTNGQPQTFLKVLSHKRVIALFNATGQKIDGSTPATSQAGSGFTSGSYVPAMIDLAVSPSEGDQVQGATKVLLRINPWENGSTNSGSTSVNTIQPNSSTAQATPPNPQAPSSQAQSSKTTNNQPPAKQ